MEEHQPIDPAASRRADRKIEALFIAGLCGQPLIIAITWVAVECSHSAYPLLLGPAAALAWGLVVIVSSSVVFRGMGAPVARRHRYLLAGANIASAVWTIVIICLIAFVMYASATIT
jgi:hypothetical protein